MAPVATAHPPTGVCPGEQTTCSNTHPHQKPPSVADSPLAQPQVPSVGCSTPGQKGRPSQASSFKPP